MTILLLLAASRAIGEVFERLGQSALVGEVLAGMILGPYVLRLAAQTPADVPEALVAVGDLGVFLLVYLAGLEMDIGGVGRSLRGGGLLLGALGFMLPFLALFGIASLLGLGVEASLFAGLVFGLTALPVAVRVLMDVGLADHAMGRLLVSCAVLSELAALTGLGILLNIRGVTALDAALYAAALTILKTALLVSLVFTFVQAFRLTTGSVPGAQRIFRGAIAILRGRESLFALSTLFVLVFAGMSQLLGLHFVVGAFFGGLLLSPQILGEWNFRQIQKTTSAVTFGLLAPVFFGLIGLRFAPDALLLRPELPLVLLPAAFAAKYGAGLLGSRILGKSPDVGRALGVGLTMHGVLELVVANLALELGIFDASLFSTVVLVSLVSTVVAPFVLRRQAAKLQATERPPSEPRGATVEGWAAPARARGATPAPQPILVGGGRVAFEVARAVGPCTVLEKEANQAKFLTAMLSDVRIVVGDGARVEDLVRAGVGPGAVVLALTDDATVNEAAVRESRKLGAARVIARAEQSGDVLRLRALGADAVVNTAEESGAALVKELYPYGESMVEIVVAKTSPAAGKPASALELPRGVLVQSVTRRGKVLVPTPDLVLEGRDSVILSGAPPALAAARVAMLGPRAHGQAISGLAFVPPNVGALEVVAGEVGPLAAGSGGTVVGLVPYEREPEEHRKALEARLRARVPSSTVLAGFALSTSELDRARAAVNIPQVQYDPSAAALQGAPEDGAIWAIVLPWTAIGTRPDQMAARKVASIPLALGLPVLVAARGRVPEYITALIDGSEGADLAGMLACDAALASGARLTLLVVTFEGDREPHEQATFVQNYARTAGLGLVDLTELLEPGHGAVERAIRGRAHLVVAPSLGRALKGREVLQLSLGGGCSVLLT